MEEKGYSNGAAASTTSNKKPKISLSTDSKFAFFDELPDDLVANIVSKLGATASCPADYFNLRLTCKRANTLSADRSVLSKISPKVFCRAKHWGHESAQFMKSLVMAGNVEAVYTLGMIKFYIFKEIEVGKFFIDLVGVNRRHPPAMYSLSIIHFNGSGSGAANVKLALVNLLRAVLVGHVDAIRELGYRFEEGNNGIRKDPEEAQRLLQQATAREIISMLPTSTINDIGKVEWGRIPVLVPRSKYLASGQWLTWVPRGPDLTLPLCPLSGCYLSGRTSFGWNLPVPVTHPVNRFLTEWFEIRGGDPGNGLRLCSHAGCGRLETTNDEFLRCTLCMDGFYCSRLCQSMDSDRHYEKCIALYANYYDDGDDEENDEVIEVDAIQDEEGDLEE